MSLAHDSKFSYVSRHGGPGSRLHLSHDPLAQAERGMHRPASLPDLGQGVPAGHSKSLGNRLSLQAYANLGGSWSAKPRATNRPPMGATGKFGMDASTYEPPTADTWQAQERLDPAQFGPAGGQKTRKSSIRMVPGCAKNSSTVDHVAFNRDYPGQGDGMYMSAPPSEFGDSSPALIPDSYRSIWTNKGRVAGNPNYGSSMDTLMLGRDFTTSRSNILHSTMGYSMRRPGPPDFQPPPEYPDHRRADHMGRAETQRFR